MEEAAAPTAAAEPAPTAAAEPAPTAAPEPPAVPVAVEAAAAAAVQQETAAEAALREAEAAEAVEGGELAGGASSDSEEEQEEEAAAGALPALQPIALETVDDAERLLDAAAAHAARPTSMWGCCGGVRDGRHYYCDSCNLYYHECCQKNQSKGRQAPLCPPCHEGALAGGWSDRKRRRVGP
jgi:hypothetical protein